VDQAPRALGAGEPDVRPLIGLSPRVLRSVPRELGFRGKTLQYLEQSVANWVMSHAALTVMVPSPIRGSHWLDPPVSAADFALRLDGLILQGGADVHPSCYGQSPRYPEFVTDPARDQFELALLRAFIAEGKPVLGICRGMQLMNVAFGGTLHQDLVADQAADFPHVLAEAEEDYRHAVVLEAGGWMRSIYGEEDRHQVNSIHHQGVDRLGDGLVVEARSTDGVIEALRHPAHEFVFGVQWHPEFHDARFPDLLSSEPLMQRFLSAAHRRSCEASSGNDRQ
jgi:putative glutamine amidotransferase